jgi:hypothetical protein
VARCQVTSLKLYASGHGRAERGMLEQTSVDDLPWPEPTQLATRSPVAVTVSAHPWGTSLASHIERQPQAHS